ncbi:MAG: type III pantothenate kinase [Clostridia bacterium]
MVLVVDIGNTNIVLGVYEKDELTFTARIATNKDKTADEYSVILSGIFMLNNVVPQEIEGIIISSVVPPLTSIFELSLSRFSEAPFIVVGPGIKTGFSIKIDNPAQLGTDMVCNVAGALAEFEKGPMIVIDMGTATTITVVDENRNILGGSISPGLRLSLNALSGGTAQLPFIDLDNVKKVIGTNTIDCMQSGVIYGCASMIDGMIERISEQLQAKPRIIITGGMSSKVLPHCKSSLYHRPNLLVSGLYSLYLKNKN